LGESYSESGLPEVDSSGTLLMVIFSVIFIILGRRIREAKDKRIKVYLELLLALSLVIAIWVVASGGRVGLLLFLVIIYLISSLLTFKKAMSNKDFVDGLSEQKYILDKKGWFVFGLTLVILLIIAFWFDLSKIGNEVVQPSESELNEILVQTSNENNKDLPMIIDEITQLTTTTVEGNDLVYIYKLIGEHEPISQQTLESSFRKDFTDELCLNQETRTLLDIGVGFVYRYFGNDNKLIGEILVKKSDCLAM